MIYTLIFASHARGYLASPMFDFSNIDMWKFKMSSYLKALELHVYLATIKRSYIDNDKYLKANAQVMIALKQTLNNIYLSMISHCDSAFAVWNMLISLEEQASNDVEREPSEDESDQACYMVQGNDSF